MVAITRLEPSEPSVVDGAVISALFRAHGCAVAEDMLMDYVTELTDRISALDAQAQRAGHISDCEHIRALAQLAADIGLISLAHTLTSLAHATDAGNHGALPAIWDRVKRVGDRSLLKLWTLPQLRV